MYVHDADFAGGRKLRQLAVGGAKRAISLRHEDAALEIEHGVLGAGLGTPGKTALSRPPGIVGWAQQARLLREVFEDLLAIPDVVATGENLDAEPEEFLNEPTKLNS